MHIPRILTGSAGQAVRDLHVLKDIALDVGGRFAAIAEKSADGRAIRPSSFGDIRSKLGTGSALLGRAGGTLDAPTIRRVENGIAMLRSDANMFDPALRVAGTGFDDAMRTSLGSTTAASLGVKDAVALARQVDGALSQATRSAHATAAKRLAIGGGAAAAIAGATQLPRLLPSSTELAPGPHRGTHPID